MNMTATELERKAWVEGDAQTAHLLAAFYWSDPDALWRLRLTQSFGLQSPEPRSPDLPSLVRRRGY